MSVAVSVPSEFFVVVIQRSRRRDDVARPVRHVRHAVRIHRRKFRVAPLFRRADRSLADIADKAAGIRLLILDHRMERSVAPHHRLHPLARFVKTHEDLLCRETGPDEQQRRHQNPSVSNLLHCILLCEFRAR